MIKKHTHKCPHCGFTFYLESSQQNTTWCKDGRIKLQLVCENCCCTFNEFYNIEYKRTETVHEGMRKWLCSYLKEKNLNPLIKLEP